MKLQVPLLLLAAAILLLPQPSLSESPDLLEFLAPDTCVETSSSPELPFLSPAEPESLSKSGGSLIINRRCGACGVCAGSYAGSKCGVTSDGMFMYCSDTPVICSQDGRPQCVCQIWPQ